MLLYFIDKNLRYKFYKLFNRNNLIYITSWLIIRRRRISSDTTESKFIEKFRAVIDDNTSLSIYNKKKDHFVSFEKI